MTPKNTLAVMALAAALLPGFANANDLEAALASADVAKGERAF